MKQLLSLLFFISLSGCADGLFYHPDRVTYSDPSQAKLNYENVFFPSLDGTRLHGWYIPAVGEEKGIIIHFHGNAQNISGHFPLVYWLPYEGYSLFMFDCRGYGLSEGSVDREGIHADSIAALDYIFSRNDIKKSNVFVLGQSLGGANAIDAVAASKNRNIRAVIIESTFVGYQDIALEKAKAISSASGSLAALPSILTSDKFSPRDNIKNISPIPILFIHGTSDQVIPIRHSQELFELAEQPKAFWVLEGGKHLEAFSKYLPEIKNKLLDYLKTHEARKEEVQHGH